MPSTVSDTPSVSLSCMQTGWQARVREPKLIATVANNFWGKEDAGVHPLLDRMQFAKSTNDELKAFYSGKSYFEETQRR